MSWLPGTTSVGAASCIVPHEHPRPLELAVAGALGEIAGDGDGVGTSSVGDELLQRLHLLEVGMPAEMQVGAVDDGRVGHHTARIR